MENLEFDINGILTDINSNSVILESMPPQTVSKIFDTFKGHPQKIGGITFYVEDGLRDKAKSALSHIVERIHDLINYNDTNPTKIDQIISMFNGISKETMTHIMAIMVEEKQIKETSNGFLPMK